MKRAYFMTAIDDVFCVRSTWVL